METDRITSFFEFRAYLKQLVDAAQLDTRSLDEYLRGVMRSVIKHEGDEFTWALHARILADGFDMEPLPFDQAWLAYTDPGEIVSAVSQAPIANMYEATANVLKYQIADLRRMQEAGILDDPNIHMGVTSPTGNVWYNFSPWGYLGCALSCLNCGTEDSSTCAWGDLAVFFWLGQIYE